MSEAACGSVCLVEQRHACLPVPPCSACHGGHVLLHMVKMQSSKVLSSPRRLMPEAYPKIILLCRLHIPPPSPKCQHVLGTLALTTSVNTNHFHRQQQPPAQRLRQAARCVVQPHGNCPLPHHALDAVVYLQQSVESVVTWM